MDVLSFPDCGEKSSHAQDVRIVVDEAMVRHGGLAGPDLFLRPVLIGRAPEFMTGRQSERLENGCATVETAGVHIFLADGWLVAAQADLQPSSGIKGARGLDHAPDDGGKSAPGLPGRYFLRKAFHAHHVGKQMERRKPRRE